MKKVSIVFVFLVVSTGAISFDAVSHYPDNILYANPWMGEIRLRANKGAILEAYILYKNKRVKMNLIFQDNKFDYYIADVGRFDTNFAYQILVNDKSDSLFLPQQGTFKSTQLAFSVPEWACGKIYYSIFPDGFYNGDKSNDPSNVVAWGRAPDKEFSYGGDLKGIIEKLSYLDSLNYDILFLQPIFSASSNHKYNIRDFATVDPALGDTVDLKNLINKIHEREKHIILKFIATHTGSDMVCFLDVVKNGRASKYYSWYQINSIPIKVSPPTYECWLSDGHFPKLNLKDLSARAFVIGYIDYWLHFGFDGIYIGEDHKIDADFVRDLKNSLKKKYPGIIILGSSENFGTTGFDGTANKRLTELLINYFIHNTITTSEFDSELRKMLFYNPSQVNLINLIDLNGLNKRINSVADMSNLLLLYAFVFTFCSSPVITYGDEVGMAEGKFPNFGSFPWTIEKQNRTLLEEIKKLINIRKTNPILCQKYFYTLYANDINRVYAYDRGGVITILNSGSTPSYTMLPILNGTYRDLTSGEKIIITTQQLRITLPAKSFKIIKREI